ncbi:MAG: DUF6152 family protein [Betaproteobacteria bacterium]
MRITSSLLLAAAIGAAPLSAGPAFAHHGWSEYDSTQALNLTGTIREAGYEHPHGHIRIETAGKTWIAVLAPPSRMEARGLTAAALAVGVQATVVGYPNRSKPEEMRAERITIAGKTVELR